MKEYHFIGIGGIGMSALANLLLDEQEVKVSGSDLNLSDIVRRLKAKGALIEQGHYAETIEPEMTVVYSSALTQSNPELASAQAQGCRLMHRSELLAELATQKPSIAVAGTHGKTTLSSLITHILISAGKDPSYAIGGLLDGENGHQGKGELFVLEADESDGTFCNYHPTYGIITNIEPEHLNHYGDAATMRRAFDQFASQVEQLLFYCGDQVSIEHPHGISYGFEPHNALHITSWRQKGWRLHFDFTFEGVSYHDIEVTAIGKHNVLNSAVACGLLLKLGVREDDLRHALTTFPGVARRAHIRKQEHAITFIDDYAHHPTEVATTLEALAAAAGERRLVLLFQPHRYSRTADHFDAFAQAFEQADHTFITDIYAAGEEPIEGVSGKALAEAAGAHYLPKEAWSELETFLRPHDLFVTMGAGDVTHLDLHPTGKYRVGIVYGGPSQEHEISKTTAKCAIEAIDRTLYDVEELYIDKEGRWEAIEAVERCDLFLPMLHGAYGEDGAIQGFFETLQKPYAGPNWRACALCMDKQRAKIVAASAGARVPKGVLFTKHDPISEIVHAASTLNLPLFVKPNKLGSSVGITKLETLEGVEEAIRTALAFDDEVLLEEGIVQGREFEFAVMGNHHVEVPGPGEKLAGGAFVNYEMKYTKGRLQATEDPEIDDALAEEGRALARRVYKALGCSGFARVDFLLDREHQWWFFEANPIPGMQPLSLFPKVWKREGLSYQKMLDRMLILALHRSRTCTY